MDQQMPDKPTMIVITGAMAAGKSTVARLLARRFTRGVHIEADMLHGLIVSGRVGVHDPGTPSGEAAQQLALRLRQMCMLGRSFHDAGFAVVLDDIILGDRWEQLRAELRDVPFTLIVLAPSIEALSRRDSERGKVAQGATWARYLHDTLCATLANTGLWVDNTEQEPDETVEEILRRLPRGRIE